MPIISNKVDGYAQDKVLFLEIENDDMLGFRICSGDIAFAHLTHEIENNAIALVDYNGERVLRQIKTLDGNKILLIRPIQQHRKCIIARLVEFIIS
jgi:SOS-response transcriptional repressor LexA